MKPRSRDAVSLLQGTVDLLILRAIQHEPAHGYAISRRVRDRTDGVLAIEDAALYQALHRLEAREWIEADWGLSENNRRAKYLQPHRGGPAPLESRGDVLEALRPGRLQADRNHVGRVRKPGMKPRGVRRLFRFSSRTTADIRTDVRDELHFHLEMRIADLMREGLSEPEARREAAREFGDAAGSARRLADRGAAIERQRWLGRFASELKQDAAYRPAAHRP